MIPESILLSYFVIRTKYERTLCARPESINHKVLKRYILKVLFSERVTILLLINAYYFHC